MNKLLAAFALPIFVLTSLVGCGGGGGGVGEAEGGGPVSDGVSATAAQYFNKNAIGNTWTTVHTVVEMVSGQPIDTSTLTTTSTVASSVDGVVSYSNTTTNPDGLIYGPPYTTSSQLDDTGALISIDGTGTSVELPTTFSVGTTWTMEPADPTTGQGAVTATIAAFDVTRTVPAGTFTDCLQINTTQSTTDGRITINTTNYRSPTAGTVVESTGTFSATNGFGYSYTTLLQPNYIANP